MDNNYHTKYYIYLCIILYNNYHNISYAYTHNIINNIRLWIRTRIKSFCFLTLRVV